MTMITTMTMIIVMTIDDSGDYDGSDDGGSDDGGDGCLDNGLLN